MDQIELAHALNLSASAIMQKRSQLRRLPNVSRNAGRKLSSSKAEKEYAINQRFSG